MTKKSRKSSSSSFGRRQRSRYQDHLPRCYDDNESHSRTTTTTTATTDCTDENTQTPQPHISLFSSYFRQSCEVAPSQGLSSGEVVTVDTLGHASPISCSPATSNAVTLRELIKGSELEDYDATAENLHIEISSIVKSVLSKHGNSTTEHPKDPVRVVGLKFSSIRKATTDMKDGTSADRSQIANRPAPITDIVPVAEISEERCPDSPLPHIRSSARVLRDKSSIVRKTKTDMKDGTSVDRSQSANRPAPITEIVPVAEISQQHCPDRPLQQINSSACVLNSCDQFLYRLQKLEPVHNKILVENKGIESNQTNCSPDLPLAHTSSSACNLIACDQLQQLEPIHNETLIKNSGDSHSPKPNVSLNFTEMMNVLDSDDDDDECSSRRDPTVETVEGYTVRKELAPTLKLLIAKYGDFAANCSFQSNKSRSFFVEQTCEIVGQLQDLELTKVTLAQLESMLAFVSDSEHVLDLKWLKKRLDKIMEAKSIIMQSRPLKEEKMKGKQQIEENKRAVKEKKRAIEALQEELKAIEMNLAALEEESCIINEKCHEATRKVKCFYNRRLGYDLL